jgi:hypothetical protein
MDHSESLTLLLGSAAAATTTAATATTVAVVAQALLSGQLLQPLANLLLDPVERCRVTALQLLLEATPQLAGVLASC